MIQGFPKGSVFDGVFRPDWLADFLFECLVRYAETQAKAESDYYGIPPVPSPWLADHALK
jgi:hypothetical protein